MGRLFVLPSPSLSQRERDKFAGGSQRERDWVALIRLETSQWSVSLFCPHLTSPKGRGIGLLKGEGLGCSDLFGDATMGRLFALPLGQAEDWGNLWARENEDFI